MAWYVAGEVEIVPAARRLSEVLYPRVEKSTLATYILQLKTIMSTALIV
jgi:hypothetical protein